MGWSWQTATFFAAIGVLLLCMLIWQLISPSAERKGILGLTTTRGDRLFISLLGSAFIFIGWLALAGSPLWGPLAISIVWSVFVFRYV